MAEPTPTTATTKRQRPGHDGGAPGDAASAPSRVHDATQSYVLSRIETAQSALWRAELTRRILTLVIAVLTLGLAWLVLDQWVYSPGTVGRSIIATGVIVALIAYGYGRLWPVMHFRISEDYAARALERDHPELGHALSSYVSLRRQRVEHPQGQLAQRVVQSVGNTAASKLRLIDAVPSEATGLLAWWAATIALLAALAIYTLASPKNSIQSVERLLRPMASLEAPKRVRISEVTPGDTEALAGRSIGVAATVANLHEDEPVYFRWVSKQSKSESESHDQVQLLPSDSGTGLNRFSASVPLSHHAQGRRQYRVVAGDASAGPYEVSIRDTPVVQIREVVYDPPTYTGKPHHTSHTGALRGVDGTRVRLVANVNRPITRAVIEFNPRKVGREIQATAGSRDMQIAADGKTVEIEFTLRLRGGAAIALQDYRLRVWDDAEQPNADPIVYPIEIVEDLPPEITIVVPQQSSVDVPINGQQHFEIHAADVDFGLAEIEIEIRRGIDLLARSSLWKEPEGKQGKQVVEYIFRPSRIIIAGRANGVDARRGGGLNVGDELEVVAIASDNRSDADDDTIVAGITKTPPARLRIVAAAKGEEGAESEGARENGAGSEGEQGEGEQGQGEQGQGEQGQGEQGQGEQGQGQEGQGEQGKGEQGKGEQGKGEQGKGEQGQGQEGQGEQGEAGSGNNAQTQGGKASDKSGSEAGESDGSGSDAENMSSGEASGDESETQQGGANSRTGEPGGSSDSQANEPPQDDAEAFERIQEYLKQNQQDQLDQDSNGEGSPTDGERTDEQSSNEQSADGERGDGQTGEKQRDDAQAASQQADNKQSGEGTRGEQASRNDGRNQGGQDAGSMNGQSQPDSEQSQSGENGSGENNRDAGRDNETGDRRGQGSEGEGNEAGDNKAAGNESGDNETGDKESGDNGAEGKGGEQSSTGADKTDGAAKTSDADDTAGEESSQGRDGQESKPPNGESQTGEGLSGGEQTGEGQPGERQTAEGQAGEPDKAAGNQAEQDQPSGNQREGNQGEGNQKEGNEVGSSSGDNQQGEGADGSKKGSENGSEKGSGKKPETSDSGNSDSSQDQGGSSGNPSRADQQGGSTTSPDGDGTESSQGGGGGQSGGGQDNGSVIEEELPDPVDLEYTKAATDMVLDYLDETRSDPDPDLLQRLKWTEQDLRRFRERWQNVKPVDDGARSDAASSSEIEEALRSLGMRSPQTTQSTRRDQADDLRSLRDSGNRRPAPVGVREAFEAFRRGLGQSTRGADD